MYIMYIKLLKLRSRNTKNLIPVNMVFLLLHHSSLLHLSGGTPEKRGRGSKEEGRWRRQEEESAVWHGSKLWRLPGQGWTAVEMMVTVMKRRWWYRGWLRNVCVCVVCVVFQVESKRGKRLTGKEIKRKTLAERRQPLGIDNLREDGLRWFSSNCISALNWELLTQKVTDLLNLYPIVVDLSVTEGKDVFKMVFTSWPFSKLLPCTVIIQP